MKDSKKMWAWVGAGIVVVAILFVIIWPYIYKSPAPSSGPAPVYAPQGQLVPNFPKSLILDNAAAINGSYSIGYSTSTNQYTAQFDSSSSMATLFDAYKKYFSGDGWTLTGTITNHKGFEQVSGAQGTNQTQVVISSFGKGSRVTITYLVK